MKLVPLGDRVVLKQMVAEETTKSGIILAGKEKERPQQAEVLAVGPGGTGRFMDYDIVVYDGTQPKLVIMIIGKTTTSHREYRWSREEAEKRGCDFFNFIDHYPNRPEYITKRLHTVL